MLHCQLQHKMILDREIGSHEDDMVNGIFIYLNILFKLISAPYLAQENKLS